jgi:hypothetical protein
MEPYAQKELKGLKTCYWLSNNYFAMGSAIKGNNVDTPQMYWIFKAKDGNTFC